MKEFYLIKDHHLGIFISSAVDIHSADSFQVAEHRRIYLANDQAAYIVKPAAPICVGHGYE